MKKIIALPFIKSFTKPFTFSASTFVLLVAVLFILLFGYTGGSKLFAIEKFTSTMQDVKFIRPYANFLSYFVPLFELFTCLLLMFSFFTIGKTDIPTRKIGIYLSALLIFEFTFYVSAMLIFYKYFPNNSGGLVESLTWQQQLVFNIFFLGLAIAAIIVMKKNKYGTTY